MSRGSNPSAGLLRVLRLAATERTRLLWGTFFLAASSAASLAYPQAIRILLDDALLAHDPSAIDRTAMLMGAMLALQSVGTGIRYVLFATAGERVVTRLRKELFQCLLDQEIAFFDQQRTGELQSRLASDTAVLQSAVGVNVSMVLRNLASALGGIVLLFWTAPTLAAIMMGVVPPLALTAVALSRRLRKLAREGQDAIAAGSAVAEETLAGIRTVRAFVAESIERVRYGRAVDRAFEIQRARIRLGAIFVTIVSSAAFSVATVVLWYGGHLVAEGAMTVGDLTSFLVYTMLVAFALGALTDLWAELTKASGAAERIFELMDRAPAMPIRGGTVPERIEGAIAFADVTFAYPARPDVRVLDRLNLSIASGEIVALVGPSGAGKSTIAALLCRLYDPQSGQVALDGRDLRELAPDWLRRQVGIVSQEPLLFSASIAENIRYARPEASEEDVLHAAQIAHAHEFVSQFPQGYATEVGERGVRLSGGQKQRIAIARAVLKDPRVLILDEATSALDAESEHWVKDALDRLMKERTTLIIAHRLSTVRDADRVVVLERGTIAQSGNHRTLMKEDGTYRRLVERQLS